jgi:hypothetical protein
MTDGAQVEGERERAGAAGERTDENDAKDENNTSVFSSPVAALSDLVHDDARVGDGLDGGHCVLGERGEMALYIATKKRGVSRESSDF